LIRAIVTVAFTGWAAYASLFIFRPLDVTGQTRPSVIPAAITAIMVLVLISFWTFFALQRMPWTFYLYVSFPCYFWQQFLVQIIPHSGTWLWSNNFSTVYIKYLTRAGLVIVTLQGMVVGARSSHLLQLTELRTGRVYSSLNLEPWLCANRPHLACCLLAKNAHPSTFFTIDFMGHDLSRHSHLPSSSSG
jgi:phosphatidylinositol glycan class N